MDVTQGRGQRKKKEHCVETAENDGDNDALKVSLALGISFVTSSSVQFRPIYSISMILHGTIDLAFSC